MSTARSHFACGTAVALYTAAAFGALLYTGMPIAMACLVAAVAGVLIAALAARVASREVRDAAALPAQEAAAGPEPEAEPAEAGFALPGSREERASREIQASLLPAAIPHVDGYHLDYDYRPCGALGGDLFDFLDLDDGRLLITLGDVSGKGPAGAIVMAMVQTLMRREAPHAEGPADLLHRVNDGFAGTVGKGIFVTAQVGLLDPQAHRLTLAGAGHHPMLLLNPGERRSTEVSARGVALGLVRGQAFADGLGETTIDIAPGDSLLMYTDGVTECVEHLATGVGESRFLAAAAAAVLPGPRDALQRLSRDLWQAGGRRDDTTLVLISRLQGPSKRGLSADRSTDDLKV